MVNCSLKCEIKSTSILYFLCEIMIGTMVRQKHVIIRELSSIEDEAYEEYVPSSA